MVNTVDFLFSKLNTTPVTRKVSVGVECPTGHVTVSRRSKWSVIIAIQTSLQPCAWCKFVNTYTDKERVAGFSDIACDFNNYYMD